ncbi:DUF6114 domain-containing protein [Gryllotalpicola reticulitermitis]|uniref:DUF6114 domain-containing protein n=1 Tax=Gryllotalpicola reticulitermitis TaxID=1184153 RepID=A0ABV8Q3V7_9MICO
MTKRRTAFRQWRSERPFWGALLIAIGGIEEFFSGQLDIGKIHIQLGLEGLQALLIPAVLLLLGILIALMPVHRIFYGIIALVLAVYSLIGVNLGGFVIGMLLSAVGGVLVVAWMPKHVAPAPTEAPEVDASAEPDPKAAKPRRRWLGGGTAAVIAAGALALAATAPQPAQAAEAPRAGSTVASGCVLLIICSPSSSSSPSPSPSTSSSSAPSSNPSPSSGGPSSSPSSPSTPTLPSAPSVPGTGSSSSPVQSSPSGTQVGVPGQNRSSAPAPGTKATTKEDLPSGATTDTPVVGLGADNSHGIFTLPSATIDGDSLQLSGTKQVGVVTVPLADGTRATAIRIECSQLTIGAFHLDTKNRSEKVNLDTDGMTLSGNVVVWVDRIGTQYGDGEGLDQSLKANPLTLGALMTLLGQGHLVLGLVGAQAETMTLKSFNLQPLS